MEKLRRQLPLNRRSALAVSALAAVFGVVVVVWAAAAGPFAALEPENGTLAGSATTPSLGDASGGKAVRFGAGGTPNPIIAPALPASAAIALNSCPGTLSQSGNYVLNQDLTQAASSTSACIFFTNVDGISLDCQNHTIFPGANSPTQISFYNVTNFALKNCVVPDRPPGLNSSHRGVVDRLTTSSPSGNGGTFSVTRSDNLSITNSTFTRSPYHQTDSSSIELSLNTITADPTVRSTTLSGAVELAGGDHNNLVDNAIDGTWSSGLPQGYAADDGIMLIGRSGDYINHNTIRNAWDAGIETEGATQGEQILNNTITNIQLYGIGGWFQNSWQGNIISGNIVSQTGQILEFYLDTSRTLNSAYMPSTYYFQGNQFIGNTFVSGNSASTGREAAVINYASQFIPPGITPVIGNNLVKNNNFGTFMTGPHFDPPTMIIDGGGNTCSPNSSYPSLACTH